MSQQRYIGTAHAFEYLSGDSRDDRTWVTWSFTVMRMSYGDYTVVLIRDFREVFTLKYRDLLLDSKPSVYRPGSGAKLGDIPEDVLREVEKALCAVSRVMGPDNANPDWNVWERVHEVLDGERATNTADRLIREAKRTIEREAQR